MRCRPGLYAPALHRRLSQRIALRRAMQNDEYSWSYAAGSLVAVIGGAFFAVFFSAIAAVLFLAQGPNGPLAAHSLAEVVVSHALAFLLAGIIAGTFNPLARHRVGAILVGIAAWVPVAMSSTRVLTGDVIPHEADAIAAAVIVSIVMGAGIAFFVWRELER